MKRFTKRISGNVYYTLGQYPETISAECTSQDVRQILKHLADYEDSNLTPEEIPSLITTIESQKEEITLWQVNFSKAKDVLRGDIEETYRRGFIAALKYFGNPFSDDVNLCGSPETPSPKQKGDTHETPQQT